MQGEDISVEQIAAQIVAREGGFVDDPDDPGGATNHGVTIGTLRRLGLDLDGDRDSDVDDLSLLSADQAAQIFLDHYYHAPGIDRLPRALQASVFDMSVNAGRNAVRILQEVLIEFGQIVDPDGVLGPHTWAAAHHVWQQAAGYLLDAYGIGRRDYYYALGDARPPLRKYARRQDGGKGGWIVRAEKFVSKTYWLSDAQHRERTASWD